MESNLNQVAVTSLLQNVHFSLNGVRVRPDQNALQVHASKMKTSCTLYNLWCKRTSERMAQIFMYAYMKYMLDHMVEAKTEAHRQQFCEDILYGTLQEMYSNRHEYELETLAWQCDTDNNPPIVEERGLINLGIKWKFFNRPGENIFKAEMFDAMIHGKH